MFYYCLRDNIFRDRCMALTEVTLFVPCLKIVFQNYLKKKATSQPKGHCTYGGTVVKT